MSAVLVLTGLIGLAWMFNALAKAMARQSGIPPRPFMVRAHRIAQLERAAHLGGRSQFVILSLSLRRSGGEPYLETTTLRLLDSWLTVTLRTRQPSGLERFTAPGAAAPWPLVAAALRAEGATWDVENHQPDPMMADRLLRRFCNGSAAPDPAAEAKSVDLLKEWLSPEQLAEFERSGTFEVAGQSGARYRIADPARPYNVHRLGPDGGVLVQHCFLPHGATAKGDVMLAQKIGLETQERHVLAIANDREPPPHTAILSAHDVGRDNAVT